MDTSNSTPQKRQNFQNNGYNRNGQQSNFTAKPRKPVFPAYYNEVDVEKGLLDGTLIEGTFRINQRNYEESYINNPEGDDQLDLLILGIIDRNRAFHGDVVAVKLKPKNLWVVREALYKAWKKGKLNISNDDDERKDDKGDCKKKSSDDGGGSAIDKPSGGDTEEPAQKFDLDESLKKFEKFGLDESLKKFDLDAALNNLSVGAPAVEKKEPIDNKPKFDLDAALNTPNKNATATTPQKPGQNQQVNQKTQGNNKKSNYKFLSHYPHEDIPDICLQKTAEVVFIKKKKHTRAATGQLKPMPDGKRNWAFFSPTDSRVPRMMIPANQCPQNFFDRPQDFAKFIFLARIEEWNDNFARGKLEKSLGLSGDVEAETEALLHEYSIDDREFTSEVLSSLPLSETQWEIPKEEFKERLDLRDEIIFTIDPKTARDLDDALHIKFLEKEDGQLIWEVGVHIADVSYFVKENTELDNWAQDRATSTYLVHKVIPMLPRILCEELCSLNAGVDRLTFSVIWNIADDGTVFEPKFTRSIIRSKVKLAYEHAQDFIENPDKEFDVSEVPELFDGVHVSTIKEKCLQLNNIALKLRANRVDHGALRLDQPKLKFALDDETKMPNGVTIYERKDANSLVEEFMLLANMAVARQIEKCYPKTALLRKHPGPKQKIIKEVEDTCTKIGFPLNGTSSSGLLSASLNKYRGNDTLMRSINQVLSMLLMKPMQLAEYFCVGTQKSKSNYAHYALACPYYTHFTSPIRRYPDVIVHRFLAASLGYATAPTLEVAAMQKVAENCNDRKVAAKAVSEGSDKVFFGLFVKQCGPIDERGVVVNVMDMAFDVLVFKYGVIERVYVNKLSMARDPVFFEGPPNKLILYWTKPGSNGDEVIEQTIQMCTVVDVTMCSITETKYQTVIKMRPRNETHTLHELFTSNTALE